MRRWIALVVGIGVFGLVGCGGDGDGSIGLPGPGGGIDAGVDAGSTDDGANATRPGCPLTAPQVSDIVGQPLNDEGNCLFGDGKGVASLTVTSASTLAGETTFNYQRDRAEQVYDQVTDIDLGDKGYIAVKDIEAEAVVVSDKGSFTLIMSSFELEPAGYQRTLQKLLDTILA